MTHRFAPLMLLVVLVPTPAATLIDVRHLIETGDYAAAESAARARLADAETAHGADSNATADALDLLVEALWRGGKVADPETRRLAERAVSIREKTTGPDGLDVATSLANLGTILRMAGDLAEARPILERVLTIREKALGPDHPDVASALQGLSNLSTDAGDLPGARALSERALRIREKALTPDSPAVGDSLHTLGSVMAQMGDYAAALPTLERALAVREKALGPDHPDIGSTLQNIGTVTRSMGDFTRARLAYERALAIAEKTTGPDSLRAASAVSNLGILLTMMGDNTAAEAADRRALAIWEKKLPPKHPMVAYGLDNLANLLFSMENDEGARPLLERAEAILEASVGPDHPTLALNLHAQALVHMETGDRPGAKRLFERVVTIQEKALGPLHPDLAATLSNLGLLLKNMGDYPGARANDERALRIRETVLGPGHPDTTGTLDNLARLFWLEGQPDVALQKGLVAEKRAREQFSRCARNLSEREALRYEEVRVSGLDTVMSSLLSLTDPAARRAAAPAAWDEEVRARALVLDEMATRHRSLTGQDDPAVRPTAEALARAHGDLATILLRGPDPGHPESFEAEVQKAGAREDRAERDLAKASAGFRRDRDRSGAGLTEVLAALPHGSALLAYVRYGRIVEVNATPPVPSYLAFIARAGARNVEVIPLGTTEEIDPLVRLWHDEVSVDPRAATAGAGAAPRGLDGSARLRAAIWDPVAGSLKDATMVFVVPDGAISLVNLATLPGPGGSFLLESGPTLHDLSAERDLVRAGSHPKGATSVLALGGADFDARPEAPPPAIRTAAVFRGAQATCPTFRSLKFEPLPGALAEADEVGSIWKKRKADVRVLQGAQADEATFKQMAPGSRILHLATHGYFVEGDCARGGDNPLLLAGLALAGANRRDAVRDPQMTEDGVLTGEEIAALDLSGVEWAVLSACETGIGRVQAGEGVLGLRRAFEIAGARTLIMSLWKVEDGATRLFMRELYNARVEGLSTAESIRRASRNVLTMQRRQGLPDNPYFWGAFVAAGDWN